VLASTTALDVAFVTALAAIAGALVAPLITWLIATARNKQDRWAVLYADRRDAYLKLLTALNRTLIEFEKLEQAVKEQDPEYTPETAGTFTESERIDITAHGDLFAPLAVQIALKKYEKARAAFADALDALPGGWPPTDPDQWLGVIKEHKAKIVVEVRAVRLALFKDLPRG